MTVSNPEPRYPRRERRIPERLMEFSLNISNMNSEDNPSLKEALDSPNRNEWKIVIQKELNELSERSTFELVTRPENARVLPCKFVLKIKRNTDGTISRFKAILVVCGNLQRRSEYSETFYPVIDFTTVRMVLTLALIEGCEIYQLDVTGAFLYRTLDETVYISQQKVSKLKARNIWYAICEKVFTG